MKKTVLLDLVWLVSLFAHNLGEICKEAAVLLNIFIPLDLLAGPLDHSKDASSLFTGVPFFFAASLFLGWLEHTAQQKLEEFK